jgi:hypothetical protein
MREDFCVFILTNRRPDNVITYDVLRKSGYTGKIYLVVDDEDPTAAQYEKNYPGNVLIFSKDEVSTFTDDYDNATDRRTITWARNATWGLAEKVKCSCFIQLDDDYYDFLYRRVGARSNDLTMRVRGYAIKSLDKVLSAMAHFAESVPVLTIAMSQGGDHFGGSAENLAKVKRKAMNSFVCSTTKPFLWRGRFNEDVNTYVGLGSIGKLFFTFMHLQLDQKSTQTQDGGISDLYKESGTYVKAFYTVITSPSAVKVGVMGTSHRRIHHRIAWSNAVPVIVDERHRKPRLSDQSAATS